MRTYIVTFEDGTEFPVTAPSRSLLRQWCQDTGWVGRFGRVISID